MGDIVLMQVVGQGKFSPVIYGHWCGEQAPEIVKRLQKRMSERKGDVDYIAARLVQEAINGRSGDTGFGIWNAEKVLTAADSHGDAGVVLINADTLEPTYIGGYLDPKRSVE